jgi:hypothetical protein
MVVVVMDVEVVEEVIMVAMAAEEIVMVMAVAVAEEKGKEKEEEYGSDIHGCNNGKLP